MTGLTEWIPKLPRLLAARRRLVAAAQAERPDALVLIDFSGFNFRLAPAIKRLGVPVDLLHQPADLGVAAGPAGDHARASPIACS